MTTMALKNYLESRLKPYDLTAEQYQVLKSLAEENGVVQSKLCELVAKSPANITRILDRLAKKECVERRDNPADRRSTLVYLTTTGENLLSQVLEELADCEKKVTAGICKQEIDLMRRNLETIRSNIAEITGEQER